MNSTWLWTTDSRITTNDRMSYASFYNQWLGFSSCHHSYLEWSASAHNLSTLTTSFQSTFEDLLCPNVLPMNTKCLLSNNLNSLTAFCYIKQVLKVIWQKGRITAAHGRFYHIRQGRQCDHLTHASLGLPKYIPKTASWSAVFAQLWQKVPILYNGLTLSPQNFPFARGSGPYLIHGFMGPYKSKSKRHFDQFSHFHRAHNRDRQTHWPRYSIYNNRPHLSGTVMRPKIWKLLATVIKAIIVSSLSSSSSSDD